MLEERLKIIDCLDAYGNLLTEHQKIIMELYYLQDLSLGEISDEHGISRQAVHDVIKRTEKILHGYEEKLRFLHKRETAMKRLKVIIESIENGSQVQLDYALSMLRKMKEDL